MKAFLVSFLLLFTLVQISFIEEAHAGKKRQARKAARKAKKEAKKECKSAGGKGSDCRKAGRAAKAETKAASGAYSAKKTARLDGKAQGLNAQLDCLKSENASKSECRKEKRAKKNEVKAASGAFSEKKTARMDGRAQGLKEQLDCLRGGGDKSECRKTKRARKNEVKAASGAFGEKKTARMQRRGAGLREQVKCLQAGGSKSDCRKAKRELKRSMKDGSYTEASAQEQSELNQLQNQISRANCNNIDSMLEKVSTEAGEAESDEAIEKIESGLDALAAKKEECAGPKEEVTKFEQSGSGDDFSERVSRRNIRYTGGRSRYTRRARPTGPTPISRAAASQTYAEDEEGESDEDE